MQYTEGTIGRVFQVRIDHGEDFMECLEGFVREKGVASGFAQFLGALQEGTIVTGPKEPVLPPDPTSQSYEHGWEVFGFASITPGKGGPHLHYHASLGKGRDVLTGCLRERAKVYIIVEVLIIEVRGGAVARKRDLATGLELPVFGPPAG